MDCIFEISAENYIKNNYQISNNFLKIFFCRPVLSFNIARPIDVIAVAAATTRTAIVTGTYPLKGQYRILKFNFLFQSFTFLPICYKILPGT